MKTLSLAFAASLLAGTALAQTPSPQNPSTTAAGGNNNQAVVTTSANAPTPAKGSTSFTQGQARSRIASQGFKSVQGLKKDANGVWHGTAMKNGSSQQVWLDYKGNVGTGNGMANASASSANSVGQAADQTLGTNVTGTNPTGTSPSKQ